MKKFKKLASMLMATVMVVGLVYVMPVMADGDPLAGYDAGVKFEMVQDSGSIYKLVFSAKASESIKMLDLVFSYDSAVVEAVGSDGSAFVPDTTPFSAVSDVSLATVAALEPFEVLAQGFSAATLGWREYNGRIAFNIDVFNAKGFAVSSEAYIPMFEFYFTFVDGVNTAPGVFEFEDASGYFVSQFYAANGGSSFGAFLKETVDSESANITDSVDGSVSVNLTLESANYYHGAQNMAGLESAVMNDIVTAVDVLGVYNPFDIPEPTGFAVTGTVIGVNPKVAAKIELIQGGNPIYAIFTEAAANGSGNSSQAFEVPGVAAGTYTVKISKAGHLSYTVTTLVVSDDVNIGSKNLVPGDITDDGFINAADYNIVVSNFGKAIAQSSDQRADVNGDGFVNAGELNYMMSSFGKGSVNYVE